MDHFCTEDINRRISNVRLREAVPVHFSRISIPDDKISCCLDRFFLPLCPMSRPRLQRWSLKKRPPAGPSPLALCSLPAELLLEMFSFLTGDSIHRIALVSRRLYDLAVSWLLAKYGVSLTDCVTVSSADALRALATAMILSAHRLQGLNYRILSDDIDGIGIHCAVLERFIKRFGFAKEDRIRTINLDFRRNTIWTSRTLLSALCGHSHEALFVCGGEIHTVTGTALLTSPNTSGVLFSPRTLDVTYPICASLSPARPWTMIIVDAQWITTLRLSSNKVWSAILPEITLPNLQEPEVAVWSRPIQSVAFRAFLNRHGRTITTLRYLSTAAQALPLSTPPLRLPFLQRLTCPAHYIVHIFPSATRTAAPFPSLTEVAVRSGLHTDDDPDLHFLGALRLLAAHAQLRNLSLRLQHREQDPGLWPVFPTVETLEVLEADPPSLPAVLAHAFPALHTVVVSFSFPNDGVWPPMGTGTSEQRRELARRIRDVMPGVRCNIHEDL